MSTTQPKNSFTPENVKHFQKMLSEYESNPHSPITQNNLASCYFFRIGTEHNYLRAAELYESARHTGPWEASLHLGILYLGGMGVERDEFKAASLLKVAAEHGNLHAMAILGEMFMGRTDSNELGIHPELAIQWLTKAAEGNNPTATRNLAIAYYSGFGVIQDQQKTHSLLEKASLLGDDLAKEMLQLYNQKNREKALRKKPHEKISEEDNKIGFAEAAAGVAFLDSLFNKLPPAEKELRKHNFAKLSLEFLESIPVDESELLLAHWAETTITLRPLGKKIPAPVFMVNENDSNPVPGFSTAAYWDPEYCVLTFHRKLVFAPDDVVCSVIAHAMARLILKYKKLPLT